MPQNSFSGEAGDREEKPVSGSLKASGISFRYDNGNRQILNHADLEIRGGERLGLTAPSGFGKTTLCRILAGYEKPDSGQVLLDGRPLSEYKGYCPVQMIWQHPELAVNPRMRLRDVLKEGGNIPDRIIESLGIRKEWLDRFPSELSGGELQRFCVARALGEGTRFLLADEISTMLDLITQSQLWHFLIEETRRRGIGLLVVSHSEPLLDRICSRKINLWEDKGSWT
ncbi:MAG: ATP-binding cassette domain-containing protein [Eubacteriales bacterium]|nr:ATP-binding cassette domain-containing protein [Eubacteriales bacterium]